MKRTPTKAWPIVVAAVVVLLACVLGGVWLLGVAPLRARYESQSLELEAAIADFHQQRWGRPVLRGEAIEGNAFEAQESAISALEDLPFEELSETVQQMREGEAPSAEHLALVEAHREALSTYRAAANHAWSWGDYPVEHGLSATEIDYRPHLGAIRLLIVKASAAPPEECLEIGADIIRLGQDRAAGRSLVALMVHSVGVEELFEVFVRCLLRADPPSARQAASELAILAEHPAPTGYSMEVEANSVGAMFAHELRVLEHLPTAGPEFEPWIQASDMLGAWAELARAPVEQRRIGEDYPDDITRYEARMATHGGSSNPMLVIASPALGRYLRRDAATRTRVRLLWALARLRSGEARTLFLDPRLHDPLTGAPFGTRETSDGLEIRGAGEDGVRTAAGAGDEVDDLVLLVPMGR